jgi:ferredoxin--NADP+ reductase
MSGHAPSQDPTFNPVFGEIQMNLIRRKEPVRGRMVGSENCMNGKSASFVRHISVDISGTALEGTFKVGQAFGIIPPGTNDRGRSHNARLYSLACPSWGEDGKGGVVSTTVKRVIDEHKPYKKGADPDDHSLFLGVCSNYLCDIALGTEVLVTGPSGKTFLLPEDTARHDYFLVAAGTGIAPFLGFLKELFEGPGGPTKSRVVLVMGTPYRTDLLYHRWFCDLARKHANFEYEVAISREPGPDGGERGEIGRASCRERV